jgi:hypothetical protein
VTMIDASGQFIVYQTYLGGGGFDTGNGIAVDSSKNAYVTGQTYSTDFPTVSPLQPNNAGGSDAFVSKISAAIISCSYSISPTSASYSAGEWNSSVSVSALTPSPWCGWTALSNDPWITITGGSSGSGNGTVTYDVAANSGSARAGTMTIAGQTFTVNQEAQAPTTYTLNVASTPGNGGTVSPSSGSYAPGTPVQLQANPASDYFFYQWSGGLTGSANPATIIMDGNKSVTATFLLSSGDDDGDGYSNATEVALGTNPKDASSHPTSNVPGPELSALIDLYISTNGDGWTNKTNWLRDRKSVV